MRGQPFSTAQSRSLNALGRRLAESPIDLMCINTGRALADTVAIASEINDACMRFVIAEHGASVYDMAAQREIDVWSGEDNPFDAIQRLLVWYRKTGLAQLEQEFGRSLNLLDKVANLTIAIPPELDYEPMAAFIGQQIKAEFPAEAGHFVWHHSVADRFLDVMPPITKGDGVRALIHWLKDTGQIETVKTIAVGNGSNDLPLLDAVDQFVCPSNSEPVVLEYCRDHSGYAASGAYIAASYEWLEHQSAPKL